jgi:hypothetical protein
MLQAVYDYIERRLACPPCAHHAWVPPKAATAMCVQSPAARVVCDGQARRVIESLRDIMTQGRASVVGERAATTRRACLPARSRGARLRRLRAQNETKVGCTSNSGLARSPAEGHDTARARLEEQWQPGIQRANRKHEEGVDGGRSAGGVAARGRAARCVLRQSGSEVLQAAG